MLLLNLNLGDGPVDVSLIVHTEDHDVSLLDVEHVCFELVLGDLLVLWQELAFLYLTLESLNGFEIFPGKLKENNFIFLVRNRGYQRSLLGPRVIKFVDYEVLNSHIFEFVREQRLVGLPRVPHPHRLILGYRDKLPGNRMLLVNHDFESYPPQYRYLVRMGVLFAWAFENGHFAHFLSGASIFKPLVHLSVLGVVLKHLDGTVGEPNQHFVGQLDLGAQIKVLGGAEIGWWPFQALDGSFTVYVDLRCFYLLEMRPDELLIFVDLAWDVTPKRLLSVGDRVHIFKV